LLERISSVGNEPADSVLLDFIRAICTAIFCSEHMPGDRIIGAQAIGTQDLHALGQAPGCQFRANPFSRWPQPTRHRHLRDEIGGPIGEMSCAFGIAGDVGELPAQALVLDQGAAEPRALGSSLRWRGLPRPSRSTW
jgi:hypothetical protein